VVNSWLEGFSGYDGWVGTPGIMGDVAIDGIGGTRRKGREVYRGGKGRLIRRIRRVEFEFLMFSKVGRRNVNRVLNMVYRVLPLESCSHASFHQPPTRDGFTSPGAHRQNHRQPPAFQHALVFTRCKALAAKEPRTHF